MPISQVVGVEEALNKAGLPSIDQTVQGLAQQGTTKTVSDLFSTVKPQQGLASVATQPQQPVQQSLQQPQNGYDFDSYIQALKGIESSGGDYKAYNRGSGAMGAYQMLPSTLSSLKKRTGDTFTSKEFLASPKLQDEYFKLLVEDNVKTLGNMGLPVNNFTLWAAHNLGPAQAKELFSGGPLSDQTVKFIKSNLPGQEPTAANYISHYGPKFGYEVPARYQQPNQLFAGI